MKLKIAMIIFVASILYIVYDLNNPISIKEGVYRRAEKLYNEGKYKEAIVKYDSCINMDYNTGLAYFYKGVCELQIDKHSLKGINDCKRGYMLVPELKKIYYETGLYKLETNAYYDDAYSTKTEENDETATLPTEDINTDNYSDLSIDEINQKGVDEFNDGNYSKALKIFKIAYNRDRKYIIAVYNIGLSYKYLEKYDSSIVFYKKALNIDKNYIDAFFGLGYGYYELSDYDKSIKYYKKYLQADPNDYSAQNNLALAYYKKGVKKNNKFYKNKACKLWKKYYKQGNKKSKDYIDLHCKNK